MQIRIVKGARDDGIDVVRDDGSRVTSRFRHKGPVPHDVTHLLVERALWMSDGFWGKVARGHDPAELGGMARAAGHASAKRANLPDAEFVEIIQAERVVESFEAELWSNGSDNLSLRAMADAGCDQSLVPMVAMSDSAIDIVRADLRTFRDRWAALSEGESVDFAWPEAMRA